MAEIKVCIQTDKSGSYCEEFLEFDDQEWYAMSDEQKEEFCREAAFNMIEWSYEVL